MILVQILWLAFIFKLVSFFLHTYNLVQGLQLKNGGIHRIIYN